MQLGHYQQAKRSIKLRIQIDCIRTRSRSACLITDKFPRRVESFRDAEETEAQGQSDLKE